MIREPTTFVAIFFAIFTIVVPRRYFLAPYVLTACFVPTDQRIIVMGLDFTVLRILIAAGVLRILVLGEQRTIRWNKFDYVLLAWLGCGAFVYIIQWASLKAVINRAGVLFDAMGLYWLFRQKVRSWDDIKFVMLLLAFGALVLAPLVALEWGTGHNPFVHLGRVTTYVREGRYRCQAAFPHSIVMGLFWATLVPLFVGLAMTEKNKKIVYWAAAAVAVFIVLASASSTPVVVLATVLLGLLGFKWRRHAGLAGLCLLSSLTALHIVMRAPVWHLISRINIVEGSTGYHRYHLINEAMKHFGQWAFIGCRSTEHWGWGLADVTNQYILEGVRGGILTLILFLTMLYLAFKVILDCSLRSRKARQRWLSWCFFVAMAGHCAGFFGAAYFGQITMLWYMMLAVVGFFADHRLNLAAARYRPVSFHPLQAGLNTGKGLFSTSQG